MEKSRKVIFYALAVLVISQFFPYEGVGRTSITIGTNYFEGGLPYGGRSGWVCHSNWLFLIMGILSFLFYTSSRPIVMYIIMLAGFIVTGLGDGVGGIMGGLSILMVGYAIYLKLKESNSNKLKNDGTSTVHK